LDIQSSSVSDGKPAAESSSSDPWRPEHSNGKVDSSPVMNGVELNRHSKQDQTGRQQDGGSGMPADAAGLPNGVHKDVASSPSHLNGKQSAGHVDGSARRDSGDGAVGSIEPQKQLLGLHPNAATATDPRLPGIGPLLPAWRSLAEAMAPVFHPVRSCPLSCMRFTVRADGLRR